MSFAFGCTAYVMSDVMIQRVNVGKILQCGGNLREVTFTCFLVILSHQWRIHQFVISGLSFATGSGRELGVKELCELYVYNSIVRVKQSSVFEIRQKFLRFLKVLLSLRDLISRSSFFKSSCIRFARSDY